MFEAQRLRRNRLSPVWPLLAFLAFAGALVAVGLWGYAAERASVRAEAKESLSIVARLKSWQVASWMNERRGDAVALGIQLGESPVVRDWLRDGAPLDGRTEGVTARMEALRAYGAYADEMILDPRGRLLFRTAGRAGPTSPWVAKLARRAVQGRTWAHGGIRLLGGGGMLDQFGFAAPIVHGSDPPIGVVVLVTNLHEQLDPTIDWWPGRSSSARTLIIRNRAGALAWIKRSATQPGAAPPFNETLAWRLASHGFGRAVEAGGPHGERLIAASAAVSTNPWGVVVTRDAHEIYAPVRRLAWMLAVAASALISAATVALLAFWRRGEAAERLRAAAILSAQFELSPDGILVLDAFDNIIAANRRIREIWDLPQSVLDDNEVAKGRAIVVEQLVDPQAFLAVRNHLQVHPHESSVDELELKDGRTIEHRSQPFEFAPGRPAGRVWYARDVTEERAAVATRLELASIVEGSGDAILATTLDGTIVSWNSAATAMYGYTAQEAIGRPASMLVPDSRREEFRRILERTRLGQESARFETVRQHKDGHLIDASVVVSPTRDAKGRVSGGSAIVRDITDVKRNARALIRAARFDALTGLPNRASFAEALQRALDEARRRDREFAVLFVDLDRFKDVNDTRGHPAGDELLRQVGQRLRRTSRDTDMVARFGGDEFAVLCHDVDARTVGLLAQQILDEFKAPFDLEGGEVQTAASIGVATCGCDATTAETILSRADIALYRAKAAGRGIFRFFTEEMDREVRERVALGAELRQAICADQFFLVYQPQVDPQSGAIIGLEALLRWRHPHRGLVSPGVFVPIAEEMGLSPLLTRWVVGEAARQLRAWLDAGFEPPVLAVNLSGADFLAGRDVEDEVTAVLDAHGIAPERLELELTESILLERSTEPGGALARLHARGFRLAIDDFGTGYSSLDYVRRFPIDRIKIDRKFVSDVHCTPANAAIVKATIGLAQALGIDVIAEGVETEAQRDLLTAWGCRGMQGYLFARPMEADAVARLLRQPTGVPIEA